MKDRVTRYLKRTGVVGLVTRVAVIWFVIAFLIFPVVNMLLTIFYSDGQFSTVVFEKFMSSERVKKSLVNSIVLALALSVTVNIVGTFLVLVTEYFEVKGAKVLKVVYISTLIYSGIVLSTGYKFIYGANGIVTTFLLTIIPDLNPSWFQGFFAVLYIMTFSHTSNHMLLMSGALKNIDYQTIEAEKNMGVAPMQIFREIVFPVLKPTFFSITVLTFLSGLTAMSAPAVVGGVDFQTINPMIVTFSKSAFSCDIASLLSLVLGLSTIVFLTITNLFERKGNYVSVSKVKTKLVKQKIPNPVVNIVFHALAYLLFFIYAMPIILVIIFSFVNSRTILNGKLALNSFTLDNYKNLFASPNFYKPYLTSTVYSILAAVAVIALVIIVLRIMQRSKGPLAKGLEYSMLIPWLLPSTLIALALMTTYGTPRTLMFGNVLIGTSYILLIGYIIIRIPFSMRMIKASFVALDDSLEEASMSMGAKGMYTMRRVILPLILPALLSVVAMNFNRFLAEYDLTVFLYHSLMTPLGPTIKAASDETSNSESVAMVFVYAVVIMIISTLMLAVSNRASRSKVGVKKRKK